jgi:hypothetical protein
MLTRVTLLNRRLDNNRLIIVTEDIRGPSHRVSLGFLIYSDYSFDIAVVVTAVTVIEQHNRCEFNFKLS